MATARAVEQSGFARRSPAVYVIDPERLAPAKDPDAYIRDRGIEAWPLLLETSECGIDWRARELLQGVTSGSDFEARRAALGRAGRWLGTLPARFALEQEDAILSISDRCGYSAEAVARSFRALYWDRESLARSADRRPSPAVEL